MKALVKAKAERGIWMEDIEKPHVGHNDVLIKVKRTAICGTDIHIFKWDDWAQATIPVPMAVGHEFSGEVVDKGIEVKGFEIGDRVSAEGLPRPRAGGLGATNRGSGDWALGKRVHRGQPKKRKGGRFEG